MRLSVVIPFHDRHKHLAATLVGLARQTLPSDQFDVVIAAYRPDAGLSRLVQGWPMTVSIAGHSGQTWNVARARNLGIEYAEGDLVLLLDADVVPVAEALERHVSLSAPKRVVVGAVRSYRPYADHIGARKLEGSTCDSVGAVLQCASRMGNTDLRWRLGKEKRPLAWALCWSGNLSVPRTELETCSVQFNERFHGWGAEDLEWAYRLSKHGFAPRFDSRAWGAHLPHERDISANIETERANFRRFVHLHPCLEVEVLAWLNDLNANRYYRTIERLLHESCGSGTLADVGLTWNRDRLTLGRSRSAGHDGDAGGLPLLGLSIPFENQYFGEVVLASWMKALPLVLRRRVVAEARRVGCTAPRFLGCAHA